MSSQLSATDYEILIAKRPQFEMLINSQYMSYLDGPFVGEMGRIYQAHFNEPFRSNCGACLSKAMHKLWNKIKEYEENNTAS